jgi:FkbM family methyltransferase
MLITITKLYSRLHEFIHENFQINIPGLGFLLREIKKDFSINFPNGKLWFNHKIADNYGRLINGRFNEKETHLFLDKIFNNRNDYSFVDIGANVGEFMLDYSTRKKIIKDVYLFEPQKEQIKALKESIKINNFTHCNLIEKAVSNKIGTLRFNVNSNNTTASGISHDNNSNVIVETTTIDEYFLENTSSPFVFLIDAEGAELSIFQGGRKFIKNNQPLMIFEYNHISKKHFNLEDVKSELGSNYSIYRLRKDGSLDQNFINTWNLVAFPNNNSFFKIQDVK